MITKRIIPCLDIKNGRTVKGVCFKKLKDAGNPVELAKLYSEEGADELIFLDISATQERRKTLTSLVKEISKNIYIPFTIGGGINSIKDVENLLNSGADKISINTSAFINPKLLKNLVNRFGSQCIVLSIDVKYEDKDWWVYLNGGRLKTNKKALNWAEEAIDFGIGEILLTSMQRDGTKKGFDLEITNKFSKKFSVPIIASGGAGNINDFYNVFNIGEADAALGASVFHYKEINIPELKKYLIKKNIIIRPI